MHGLARVSFLKNVLSILNVLNLEVFKFHLHWVPDKRHIHDMSTWGKTKLCLPWRVGSEFYTAASSIAPVHKELWQEDSVSNEILSDAQMCQSLHFGNFTRVSHSSRHIFSMYGRTFLVCLFFIIINLFCLISFKHIKFFLKRLNA